MRHGMVHERMCTAALDRVRGGPAASGVTGPHTLASPEPPRAASGPPRGFCAAKMYCTCTSMQKLKEANSARSQLRKALLGRPHE